MAYEARHDAPAGEDTRRTNRAPLYLGGAGLVGLWLMAGTGTASVVSFVGGAGSLLKNGFSASDENIMIDRDQFDLFMGSMAFAVFCALMFSIFYTLGRHKV